MNRGHIEHCIDVSPQPHSASVTQIETLGRGVYAVLVGGVILAALLAGMALMRTETATESARLAEREAKLAREDVRVLQAKLIEHGINPDEHETDRSRK